MLLEAQKKWPLAARKFGSAFRYQYVVSKAELDIPQFRTFSRASWKIHAGNGLPVCQLSDRNGGFIGYLLGVAVGPVGLINESANVLPFSLEDRDFWKAFEKWLIDVAGRYAFLIEAGGETRFYCDPVGMIGAVYNKADRLISASPLLAIFDELMPNPKFDFEVIREHRGKFSLFHTADERVRRLNPNYYLELEEFSEHRHWPKNEKFLISNDQVLGVYDEIFDRASYNLAEISRAYPVSFPISGGQDSRLLLAFAKDHGSHVSQFYTHVNNYATRRDAAIGGELCKALCFRHEVHDRRNASIPKRQRNEFRVSWNMAFGAEVPMPAEYENGVILQVPEKNIILRGHQTDILRAVYVSKGKEHWQEADWQIKRLLIVPRELFGRDTVDRFSDDFFTWQRSLPDNAMEKAADFMFLEVYYNSTVGATFPALWRNFYLSPFNSRRLIGLSLSFSEEARRLSLPVFDIVERYCPKLSRIPYDFELHPNLGLVGDKDHYREVTEKRVWKTQRRLADHLKAVG
ncbi:hypothetical protein [Maritimibacter sp. HL-12]|uniref:hypothetical protein n=1 Tax=Maritimibacter sp. HL-12 TaxID=1162418 RepID=UPI000A0F0B55|nr:hypothetical protein [Maritimibacter sp. HL-12]SMH32931.1 hypothetical protein SAMN05661107_0395 [Maritimibacter sp. HL-12]